VIFFGQLRAGNKDRFVASQPIFLLSGSIALSPAVREQGAVFLYRKEINRSMIFFKGLLEDF
jgi:hypothetical protein